MGGLVTCSRRGDCWDTLPHDPDSEETRWMQLALHGRLSKHMKPHRNRVFRFTPTIYFWRRIVKQALCLSSHLYHLLRVCYSYKTDRTTVMCKRIFVLRCLTFGLFVQTRHISHLQLLKRAPGSGVLEVV